MTLSRVGALGMLSMVAFATGCSIDNRSVTFAGVVGHADAGGPVDGAVDIIQLPVCKGIPVNGALITDFSYATPGTDPNGKPGIVFGIGSDLLGGSYTYSAPFLTAPQLSLEPRGDGQALRVTAIPGVPVTSGNAWLGFGFGIGIPPLALCLDASGYSGVQFTIEGSLGTCQLEFGVLFSEDDSIRDTPVGACAPEVTACYTPLFGPLVPGPGGIVMVPFADMPISAGSPTSTVDTKAITGIQWELIAPLSGDPCVASFTVDDVSFFR